MTASGRGYRLLGGRTARQEVQSRAAAVAGIGLPFAFGSGTTFRSVLADLIGRDEPIRNLLDLLSNHRIVTLTGPGGIGKAALLSSVIASGLGMHLGQCPYTRFVARAIGGQRLLLILYNCDHVIEAAGSLAETLARSCPGVAVLTTSRELSRVEAEKVYRVPRLEVPPHDQQQADVVLGYAAVQLTLNG